MFLYYKFLLLYKQSVWKSSGNWSTETIFDRRGVLSPRLVCGGNPVTDQLSAAGEISVPQLSKHTVGPSSLACGFLPCLLLSRPGTTTRKQKNNNTIIRSQKQLFKTGTWAYANETICGDESSHHTKGLFR